MRTVIALLCITILLTQSVSYADTRKKSTYQLSTPEMLPDNFFYKALVLRNKITEKLIIGKVKKLEYDLLYADKTIYASKLLIDKGNKELAKETALKGENYYSMLVMDYNSAQLTKTRIPKSLDNKILRAGIRHQELFDEILQKVPPTDQEAFLIAKDFSKRNYELLVNLQKNNK